MVFVTRLRSFETAPPDFENEASDFGNQASWKPNCPTEVLALLAKIGLGFVLFKLPLAGQKTGLPHFRITPPDFCLVRRGEDSRSARSTELAKT